MDLSNQVTDMCLCLDALRWVAWSLLLLAGEDVPNAARAEHGPRQAGEATTFQSDDVDADGVEPAAAMQPQEGVRPDRLFRPDAPGATPRGQFAGQLLGPTGTSRSLLSESRQRRAAAPASDLVLGFEAGPRATSDVGSLLGKSPSATGLGVQRRTPIVTDPRARGRSAGQQLASGSFWFPARQDLDTLLSKIDSRAVHDVIIIKGPYSAIYGPGFSFYDVALHLAPRFENGYESHGSTSFDYQTNGESSYGRQSVLAGASDWGVRAEYGHRTGNDYEAGDELPIPSSYKSRDLHLTVGFDLSPTSSVELSYLRLDSTDVEFPGQAFDIDFLVTDGLDVKYTAEGGCFDRLSVETWYNRTRFEGNSQRSAKRRQIPQLDCPDDVIEFPICENVPRRAGGVLDFAGFTDADVMSTGFRAATTLGTAGCPQLMLGADLRYLEQELNEFRFSPAFFTSPAEDNFNFPIPRSHQSNPGLFAEQTLPISDRLSLRAGGRIDWVSANASRHVPHLNDLDGDEVRNPLDRELRSGGFSQNFGLWSLFSTAQYAWEEHWTARAGVGYAMRPPTLTQLYAGDVFLAILQQGFSFVRGDPRLDPERLLQVDLALEADYGRLRGFARGFHGWVRDYITYEAFASPPGFPLGPDGFPTALGVRFTNTDRAILAGFELAAEYDWNDWLTPFATMSFVQGRDHTRGPRGVFDFPPPPIFGAAEPLPGIAPLETRLGLRLHDSGDEPRWTIELAARTVDKQDRVASSLLEQPTPGFTTFDARGYWKATEQLRLTLGVENLTDKHYREHLDLRTGQGVFQPGINFYAGVELQY
jgi:outer membrane receptor protein involved in Fe transport